MKKFFLPALLAALMPYMASAQFSVGGKVTDSRSGHPLAGASVSTGNRSALSNADGQFILSDLRPGTYSVRIRYIGYKDFSAVVSVRSDEVLNAALEPGNIITDEVIVRATRAGENSATTFRNLTREEIEKNNQGQDLPYLLNQTPSVVVNSDAGTGIGYTGIRIRGSDATRINVTINGIPLNNPESQGSFFVNIPDFASSVDNIQVQRGVGTSTNGAGAFGGSLNIQTTTRRDSAYAELNNSFGSYDTWKNTVNVGTGLINDRFTFDARLSRIQSDGYIDRAFSDLKSYFLTGAFYGKKDLIRANVFSGTEKTYQAWYGTDEFTLKDDRRHNEYTYDDQTDNYTQDHYQLLYTHTFDEKLSFNTAFHYTYGCGYYEEYQDDDALANYRIPDVVIGDATITSSDLVRRRWLDNHFYGLTYSLNYTPANHLNFVLGGAYNEYDGDHFGEVIWARYANYDAGNTIRHRYYDGNGFKTDFNIYGRANLRFGKLNLYGDLQYRRISYTISGTDKNLNTLGVKDHLNFFNPKAGVTWSLDNRSNVYASFAVGNKEPNRDDYINAPANVAPLSENLKDIEAGYRFRNDRFSAGLNGFWMIYKDQLILTGKINDVGEPLRQNVKDSYRLGLELDGQWTITPQLSWAATASLSRNRIKHFTEYVPVVDEDWNAIGEENFDYRNTAIAYSPSFIGSSELAYQPFDRAEIAFLSKYVGRQYLDNTSDRNTAIDDPEGTARVLNAFFVNDLRLRYNTAAGRIKNVAVTLQINNIFRDLYENNGYTYRAIADGTLYTTNYYFPQAPRNFMLSLNVRF